MIKVLIADDHALVRRGINGLLEIYSDIKIVGEAGNGKEAIEICGKDEPDIVLMDLIMPEMDGIEATKIILEKWPSVKIIILTSFIDKKLIEKSLRAGAIGYILKNISGDNLLSAIRDAYIGKSTLSSEASDILISDIKNPSVPTYRLTSQEKNILSCLVQGMSNKKIAQEKVLSISTVKFHVSNILSKLGVSSRSEAISLALKNKLIK